MIEQDISAEEYIIRKLNEMQTKVDEIYETFKQLKEMVDLLQNNPQEFMKKLSAGNPMLQAMFG